VSEAGSVEPDVGADQERLTIDPTATSTPAAGEVPAIDADGSSASAQAKPAARSALTASS